jgi:hypothetical protein
MQILVPGRGVQPKNMKVSLGPSSRQRLKKIVSNVIKAQFT